jgi:hypothetical protein
MPYDPTLPLPNSPLESQVIRDQFQALFNLINNIATITAAQVDGVTTVNPGDPANVSVSVSGGTLHLSFSIPRGNDGAQGEQGMPGQAGPDGPMGPPFASAIVDSVNTLNPGEPATVDLIFDGSNVRFTFGIPRGSDGATGATGQNGEVTQVDLNNALQSTLAQTSSNSNSVNTLDNPFTNDPPTLADLETMRQAYNDLVLALRR